MHHRDIQMSGKNEGEVCLLLLHYHGRLPVNITSDMHQQIYTNTDSPVGVELALMQ